MFKQTVSNLNFLKKKNFHDLGNFGNCTSSNACGEDEGDCDYDDECKEGHKCGTNNCRSTLNFNSQFDCCDNVEEDFCTHENLCGVEQGDCDSNDMCLAGHICGLNNCQTSLGYDSEDDCCYVPSPSVVGDEDFCTTVIPCGVDEGDCDSHEECQENLICGTDNCQNSLGFDPETDCCYGPAVGDEHFCRNENLCAVDEGDCDAHEECQENLICGSDNCLNLLGFDQETDCCYNNSQLVVGDEDFCTSKTPCQQDQGDCDTHDDCMNELLCDAKNCADSLGFESEVDCCCCCNNDPSCESWAADGYCSHTSYVDWMSENCAQSCNICTKSASCYCFDTDATSKMIKIVNTKSIVSYFGKGKENSKHSPSNPQFRDHPMHWTIHPYNQFVQEEELLQINPLFKKLSITRSKIKRNKKTKPTNGNQIKLTSHCVGKYDTYENSGIVCNDLASSAYGLIVMLNPNQEEYSKDAVKNNFVGFKTLVHSPYDFPEVDAVGMANDQNIQSNIGIRGYHSWITEAADRWRPDQKKCSSRDDITLDVFNYYTRKNCILECKAKVFQDICGCLPYHYPDFYLAWEGVNSTACNYTGLLCLSKVSGIIYYCVHIQLLFKTISIIHIFS